jgi:serine protease Do
MKNIRSAILIAFCLISLGACVQQQTVIPVSDVAVPLYDRNTANPIAIERIVSQVTRGQPIGTAMGGLLCVPHVQLIAGGGHGNITDSTYIETIHQTFASADYPITNSPKELFSDQSSASTRLRLAGRITEVRANICFPMAGFGDLVNGKGEASVKVEWQFFDSTSKSVILKTTSEGYGSVQTSVAVPLSMVHDMAIAMATRRLIVSPEFRQIATTRLDTPASSSKR